MAFVDAREMHEHELPPADLCIVGAGPAGLSIARALAPRGLRITVLESGGLDPDARAQALAAGRTTGDEFEPLEATRARRFGGTAHLWNTGRAWWDDGGFRHGLLHAVDFERRAWLPHSVGWPFGPEQLAPYVERASAMHGLGAPRYEGEAWADEHAPCLPLDGEVLTTSVWKLCPAVRFTRDLEAEFRQSPVRVLLNASAIEILTNGEGGAATHVRVRATGGSTFRVPARAFVLACGGIENTRLLLLSHATHPAGLGNGHGLVGRYFMEHQWVTGGRLVPADPTLFARTALYDTRSVRGTLVAGKLDFTDDTLRRHQLLNVSAAFVPRHRRSARFVQAGPNAASAILRSLARGRLPEHAGAQLRATLRHLDYVVPALLRRVSGNRLFPYARPAPDLIAGDNWSALSNPQRRWHAFEVILHCEQAPHPENRVTLDDAVDELGVRRARLHWEWRDVDQSSVARAQSLLQAELARAGVGRYEIATKDGGPILHHPGLHHHMGTTRMHPSAREGVVDGYGRVHGLANLYVAGCSQFPSGGYMNPTLTIVALALRQADHLAARLSAPAPDLTPSGADIA
ncbi:MAG TPA: GMC family oxidoreductase [Gemmatimonadaceae bacterium]|nr:GMC family oxidoreductase [Gemmatimonadaceae bacterium]